MTNDYGNLELHQVLLAAMKDIDKICREHGLKYYLHAGTLLGAINHKGFIPWDDDVDISMTPEDFKILSAELEHSCPDKYSMKTYDNTPDYYSKLNKLQILGAHLEHNDGSIENVFIDISLFHNAPDRRLARWIQCKELEFWDKVIAVKAGRITPKSLISKCILGSCAQLRKEWIGNRTDRIMERFDSKNTEWYALMINFVPNPYTGMSGYYNDFVPRRICENPKDLQFEDAVFMVYSEPETDLVRRYGNDYWRPYPEEKRVSKHDVRTFFVSENLKHNNNSSGDGENYEYTSLHGDVISNKIRRL